MTLREWLAKSGQTRADLAERIGSSPRTIGHLATGDIRPSTDMAQRIERATAGAVTAADWPPRRDGKAGLRRADP